MSYKTGFFEGEADVIWTPEERVAFSEYLKKKRAHEAAAEFEQCIQVLVDALSWIENLSVAAPVEWTDDPAVLMKNYRTAFNHAKNIAREALKSYRGEK